MYETFFDMQHTPFVRDVPVSDLYISEVLDDVVGRLTYVADRQLFAVVTGDAGCGKSTMIRRFVASLPKDQYITLYEAFYYAEECGSEYAGKMMGEVLERGE